MNLGRSASLVDGKVPVFVFPTSLTFCADDKASHKQILALYNPYDFLIKFKVLSNSPMKYVVVDAEGVVQPFSRIDILVRHSAISPANYGITDLIRIQVLDHGKVLGRKDVPVTLLATKPEVSSISSGDAEQFKECNPTPSPRAQTQQLSSIARETGPNKVIVLAAVICIAALMLPTEDLDQSSLPSYLHLSVNQKLILSFTLGLVAMVILRTSS